MRWIAASSISRAFFVVRLEGGLDFKRLASRPVESAAGVMCDQIVRVASRAAQKRYAGRLRRIRYRAPEPGKSFEFLTNNLVLSATTLAALYRRRWQIALFFKWIKQNLRIKSFFGTTPNAVMSQIWIAVSVYGRVAIIKKRLQLDASLYTILQTLSVTTLEITPMDRLFLDPVRTNADTQSAIR